MLKFTVFEAKVQANPIDSSSQIMGKAENYDYSPTCYSITDYLSNTEIRLKR